MSETLGPDFHSTRSKKRGVHPIRTGLDANRGHARTWVRESESGKPMTRLSLGDRNKGKATYFGKPRRGIPLGRKYDNPTCGEWA